MTTKKIKTSDILGDNYYIYELTSSNYTPALNDTITITCTMKDVYGAAASSKSITLYQNGTSKGAQTTNSSGVATWSITCSTAGLQKFNIKDTNIEVLVDDSLHDITLRFEDDCSDDARLSNYGDSIPFNGESSNEWNTYHSSNFNVYELSGSGGYFSGREILPLHGINNGRVRIKFYLLHQSAFNQLCIFCTDQTPSSTEATYPYGVRVRGDSLFQYFTLTNEETIHDETTLQGQWCYLEAIKNDKTWTMNLYDDTLDLIASETKTNLATIVNPNWYLVIQTETEDSMVGINEIVADSITDGIVPYNGVQKSSDNEMKTIAPRNGEIDLNDYTANGNYIYLPSHDTSGIDTYHFPSDITVDDAFTLIVENYPYSESDSVVHQTLYPLPYAYTDPATVYIRYTYDDWTKVGEVDIDLPSIITLFASKQKLDENESFKIYANIKDNDGHAVNNETLTLMCQYESYSNPDMWATGWVRDVGFYVNDTTFKGDWSCSFKVNSTPDHTGLQLYISSEQRILFSTLGATSTSEIEITCNDNTITINVDGTDYGTTYTQNINGTKVGFFTHEDYTVSIKDFVVNSGMLYKDCGSQTTDSNGNCSWSFNDGLSKGFYSFYIDNVAVDVFVGLFVDANEKIIYKSNMTVNDNNWIHSHDSYMPTVTYTANGCTVTGTRTYDRYYKLNTKIKYPFCFVCEFDIISTTQGDYTESTDFVVGNIQIRQQNDQLRIGDENRVNDYITTMPTLPIHIKVEYGISSAIVYVNNLAVGSWATNYDYIGFKTYRNRSITIKNLEIRTFDSQDWYDINIANFNGNETIIDDHIAAGSSVKFTYNKTDSTDCEGYIQLGYPMPIPYGNDNFISIGVIEDSGGGLNKLSVFDNVSGDEWMRDLPNKNSFDIEIKVPNFEYNLFDLGETTEWDIDIVVDGSTYRYNSAGHVHTSSDNVYVFNRNNIYKVVQDTNSTITNLHYIRSTNSDIVSQNDNRLVTSNAVYDSIKGKMDSSLVEPVELVVTYTDDTTETISLLKYLGN